MAITNFVLGTLPEFIETAQALTEITGAFLNERVPRGRRLLIGIETTSVNSSFNLLIAEGMVAVLAEVYMIVAFKRAALGIAQEILRFMSDHPEVQYALATNFPEESSARRVIDACGTANRESEEAQDGIEKAGDGLSVEEFDLWTSSLRH
jgi:hypothetical protein